MMMYATMLVFVTPTLSHILIRVSKVHVGRPMDVSYGCCGRFSGGVLLGGEVEGILGIVVIVVAVVNAWELTLLAHGTLRGVWAVHLIRTRGNQGKGGRQQGGAMRRAFGGRRRRGVEAESRSDWGRIVGSFNTQTSSWQVMFII